MQVGTKKNMETSAAGIKAYWSHDIFPCTDMDTKTQREQTIWNSVKIWKTYIPV